MNAKQKLDEFKKRNDEHDRRDKALHEAHAALQADREALNEEVQAEFGISNGTMVTPFKLLEVIMNIVEKKKVFLVDES